MPADDPRSPACLAHEADDTYMGFATHEEIVRFLTKLEGAPAATQAEMLRKMLSKVRDDVLHAELSARLEVIKPAESKA